MVTTLRCRSELRSEQYVIRVCLALALHASASPLVQAQVSEAMCGPVTNAYGPFDYRADHYRPAPEDREPHSAKLRLVESAHFPSTVEMLLGGSRVGANTLWGDMDYTLRAFPNHHRALASVLRWASSTERLVKEAPPRPVECYFERAVRFKPDDNVARLLYARFLLNAKRREEAIYHIELVAKSAGDSAITHFNVGMLFADAEKYDEALAHAHRAIELGSTRPELAKRLQTAGRWRESTPKPASSNTP